MNLDDLLKSIRDEDDDDSKGGKDLDDLLESIREEDDDSKGAKIDTEKFLKRRTFSNPLKGQRYQAPGLPSAPPIVVKPTVVNVDPEKLIPQDESATIIKVEPDKLIPKDESENEEIIEKLNELIAVIKDDNALEEARQDYDKKIESEEKRKEREKRIEVGKIFGINRTVDKVIKKSQSIFDSLIKFLAFTVLGQIVKFVNDFLKNPKNKKFLEDAQNFIRGIPDKLREVRDKLIPVVDWFKEQGPKIAKFAEDFRKLLARFPFLGTCNNKHTSSLSRSMGSHPIFVCLSIPRESLASTSRNSPSYWLVRIFTNPSPPSVKGQLVTSNFSDCSCATSCKSEQASVAENESLNLSNTARIRMTKTK